MSQQVFWNIQDQYHAVHSAQWPAPIALTGWFAGGTTPAVVFSTIERVQFATETVTNIPAKLTTERAYTGATEGGDSGWFAGGFKTTAPQLIYSNIGRFVFSTETRTTLPAPLTVARTYSYAVTGANRAWFAGGDAPSVSSSIDRLDLSSLVVVLSPARLPYTASTGGATEGAGYGWFAGGFSGSALSSISKLNFATETTSQSSARLTQAAGFLSGLTGNGLGWFGMGTVSTMDKFNFYTETATQIPLATGLSRTGAARGYGLGWFAGGLSDSNFTTNLIQKFNFATEQRSTSPIGLTVSRYGAGGVSS